MTPGVRGIVRVPQGAITDELGDATVRWVGGLFMGCVLLQRLAVPNMPVSLLLPFIVAGVAWGCVRGLAQVDPRRMTAWLLATFATGVALIAHATILDRHLVSVGSWALFLAVWLPFTVRLVDRRPDTFVAVLRVVVRTTAALAGLCVFMMASQFAGLPYRDWMAEVVPSSLMLDGFVITYPISYGSPIYRANGWIGLEPSMVSLYMGIGVVAAILLHSRAWVILLLMGGLVAATSGSGFAIIAVALVVLALTPARRLLRRYLGAGVFLVILALTTPMGRSIIGRLGEGGEEQSSTSLRAIYPYEYLWPSWIADATNVLFGVGPGSSNAIALQSGILGLLTPSPVKIFYDYGLIAGAFLAAMILICYVGGYSRTLSISLLASLWTLQPGTTTMLVVAPLLLLVTLWSPRPVQPDLEAMIGAPDEPDNRRRRPGGFETDDDAHSPTRGTHAY